MIGPTSSPVTPGRAATCDTFWNMMTNGDFASISVCIAWYICARFCVDDSASAACVSFVSSGMSHELRHASILKLDLSELSGFQAKPCALLCGSM